MRWLFPGDPRPVYTRASFFDLTLAHVELVALSSLAAAVIGIGLGIFVTRESGREFAAMAGAMAAIGQTFPPVAVLALTIPVWAMARRPPSWRLCLYAIFPVIAATVTGLQAVPGAVSEAAVGMGFAPRDVLWKVELPLAFPFILAGASQCGHHQYRNGGDRIGGRRLVARLAHHRGTLRVEPGLCLGGRGHCRAACHGDGPRFCLARGFRPPRRAGAALIMTPFCPATGTNRK